VGCRARPVPPRSRVPADEDHGPTNPPGTLRCEVLERLITFLNETDPDALPPMRAELDSLEVTQLQPRA
jgi:hypothetical protein